MIGNLPGLRWSDVHPVSGPPPVGEVITTCIGCHRRLVSGDPARARMTGPLVFPVVAHADCAELLEAGRHHRPGTERPVTWTCWSCGKSTRSGMDDAMDCFCDRCPRCGGLTDCPSEGEGCQCPDSDDAVFDDFGDDGRACANCGCTEFRACEGGCWWVTEDLCSACAPTGGSR